MFAWIYRVPLVVAAVGSLLTGHAQQIQAILVLDSAGGAPVPGVAVAVDGELRGFTDAQGQMQATWKHAGSVVLRFEHTGYRSREVHLKAKQDAPLQVYLVQRDLMLPAITIGLAAPEEVFRRSEWHAADLLINAEGLWVLAYEHPRLVRAEADAGKEILRDVRLVLLDTAFQEVASCPVPEDVLGLRHGLRSEVLIEGTRTAFAVGRNGDEIVLQPFGLAELRNSVLPWTDSIPGYVIGSNAQADYPALDHLAYDPFKDTLRRICTVVDSFMMDLFRSEYKYLKGPDKVLAMNLATELGVDKETVAGYMVGFSHNIWYRPLYAPLFVVGDTLLVFDHARGRLRKFSRLFVEGPSAPLAYLQKGEVRWWTGRVIQDRAGQQVYAEYERNGSEWLREVDPITGRLGSPVRLTERYPQRVQVFAGYVYYIWRPAGSMQKRSIYREKL
jgi:hypothetical protein